MGMLGMFVGAVTTIAGVIKDDEELTKKGLKRTAIGATTLILGDFAGVSDVVGEAFVNNDA